MFVFLNERFRKSNTNLFVENCFGRDRKILTVGQKNNPRFARVESTGCLYKGNGLFAVGFA
jgi:hypothetical protein